MQLSKHPRRLRATQKLITTVKAVCAVAIALFAFGCDPGCDPFPCDDGDPCTVDTCLGILEEPPCMHSPIDCGPQVCDPENGECVDCVEDSDCTDGEMSDGTESCVANECVEG